MRNHVREAVVRLARRRKIAPGDTRAWTTITIRDVIEEAGISIGTFYKYFKDRSDLAQTLWAEPVARLRSEMQADFDVTAEPADKVRSLLEHYVKFAVDNHRLFKSVFLFVRPDDNPRPDPVELENEVFYRNLCVAFREGQESGEFRSFDPHEMAQIFWAAIHGSLALPINVDRYRFDDARVLSSNMIDTLLALIAQES